ncbi:protein translocase subunit SecD [Pseudonocardia sichuanensis]|uniref:Protein translocase subunit SecD n=1 Tax=Pseudonocardia kunmingensis TaxID=630975 RepID=A0A543D483_9PSEU|nr:protein translocase subunit SecD [Pseudonocardia kunmingensis]TQM04130.1 preprotein translocase subunit SecD [Pseudonocardia kunmingensis]
MATTPGHIRPWRYLAAFVGVVAVLYSLVFFTGDGNATPKLGIDLQGGTRVTLQPRTETGAEPPRDQLVQAQQIIEQRVNGLGVSGAEVVLDGSNLTITVPGQEGEQARNLGQTAQLRFREVIAGPFAATPPAPPAPPAGEPGAPPAAEPGAPPAEPAPQPQGMGGGGAPVEREVAPVAHTEPLQDPPPPPTPEPAPAPAPGSAPPAGPADPELAAAIDAARATRQSTDPATQEAALMALDCNAQDPLRGYDDPTLPLVACNQDGTEKYVLGPSFLEGTEIASAQAAPDAQGVGYVVSLTFESQGAQIWGEYTTNNVGKQVAFTLDTEVVSAPSINQPIFGATEISGQFNQEDAEQLASVLRYGSLPLSFESSEAQTVSATLGLASLQAGLLAGAIGLGLVFIYSLFYYRVLGVLTILSLVLSGVIVYGVLVLLGRWIGFTLDLAGVAGFIVAIGITADSFIIYFERLKDEMREGRTFRSAVPRGWVRARRTILSADAVSFLAAAVLYLLAVGQVRGFAFTLGLSTVLDLIVVFLVTHPLVALAAKSRVFSSPGLSGLGEAARAGAERRRATAVAGRSKGA